MNKNRFLFEVIVLAAAIVGGAVACSSSGGGGGGSVTGTVGGSTVSIKDVVSAKITGSGSDAGKSQGEIIMANQTGLCAELTASSNDSKKNASAVFIAVANVDKTTFAPTAPTAPGTYSIFVSDGTTPPPEMAATLSVFSSDASCMTDDARTSDAVSGSVTITAVSGDKFSGSYDVTLANGDHITGKFNPEACPALNEPADTGSGSGSGSATCT